MPTWIERITGLSLQRLRDIEADSHHADPRLEECDLCGETLPILQRHSLHPLTGRPIPSAAITYTGRQFLCARCRS